MSATETVKVAKKKGRPKKVKVELPVVSQTPDTKEQARKAVEEILSQASVQASNVELVSPVSIEGAPTGASSHDNLEHAQEDYIPGTRVLDIQLVPRRAYDEDLRSVRQVGLPSDYHYCWVHQDKVTQFRIMRYKFCSYSGGGLSGLAERGFQGTGIYEKTFDNHVRNGDMFLMYVPIKQHEVMVQEDAEYASKMESSAENEAHNEGYRRGIRTFKEVDGVTLYN